MQESLKRRQFIKMSSLIGVSGVGLAMGHGERPITPPQTEGPFFPIKDQKDKDIDLTQVMGHQEVALGQKVIVKGLVLQQNGDPIPNALIDVWQACASGKYNHPADPNDAPLDPHFQYWAKIKTDQKGQFQFKTIIPGAYPATSTWMRPPHIHFKIDAWDMELTTQMYFKGDPLNDIDKILINTKKQFGQEAHDSLIVDFAKKDEDELPTGQFVIVMNKTPNVF